MNGTQHASAGDLRPLLDARQTFQSKIKRQIEILGLCITSTEPLHPVDLAVLFGCEELTIKRDLQDLRRSGIAVHSTRTRGVRLMQALNEDLLRALIIQYLGICASEIGDERATAVAVRRQHESVLGNVVTLQRCIEERRSASIDYVGSDGECDRGRIVHPLQLFQSEGSWRLLARHAERIKQFHIIKLSNVRMLTDVFEGVERTVIDEMFRHSFRSWIGTERHVVQMRLSSTWAHRVKSGLLLGTRVIAEHADGGADVEAVVNSLDEIASWVVSRGSGVEVLIPEALRARMITLARATLSNYPDESN